LFNRGLPVAFKKALIKHLISIKNNSRSGWFSDGGEGEEKNIEIEAGRIVEKSVKIITYFRGLDVSVTRGTTSHGEAEMAKVSDYGIFDFGYAK
jgi:hypothetical protein